MVTRRAGPGVENLPSQKLATVSTSLNCLGGYLLRDGEAFCCEHSFHSLLRCSSRFLTDITRSYSLFSTASSIQNNDFLILKTARKGSFHVLTRGQKSQFYGLPDERSTWYSICSTWDSNSGLAQVWINGNPSTRKIGFKGNLDGELNIVLGQKHGSCKSFEGMITDVHMWDYVLSDGQIQRFANDLNFTPGNVINWRALDFTIVGDVLIEDNQTNSCQ
ncbi:C-reactive protein-like [Sardina pilchardus]|uniref:C-reactive protein-like n=1 Tax=Sardina pilchardus TaxID=27697 RepID=UPI002E0EE310